MANVMSGPKLTPTLTVARYIFAHPRISLTQIREESGVSKYDCDVAIDILGDCCFVNREVGKTTYKGQTVWTHVYEPEREVSISDVERYLKTRLND